MENQVNAILENLKKAIETGDDLFDALKEAEWAIEDLTSYMTTDTENMFYFLINQGWNLYHKI